MKFPQSLLLISVVALGKAGTDTTGGGIMPLLGNADWLPRAEVGADCASLPLLAFWVFWVAQCFLELV